MVEVPLRIRTELLESGTVRLHDPDFCAAVEARHGWVGLRVRESLEDDWRPIVLGILTMCWEAAENQYDCEREAANRHYLTFGLSVS